MRIHARYSIGKKFRINNLFHAERNNGVAFTGTKWQFYGMESTLSAAPNEFLDFAVAAKETTIHDSASEQPLRMDGLSAKKKKKFRERMRRLRAKYENRERKAPKLVNPVKNACYDDVYDEGMNWLDSLAGEPLPEGEHVVQFSGEVWKSPTRKGGDVP